MIAVNPVLETLFLESKRIYRHNVGVNNEIYFLQNTLIRGASARVIFRVFHGPINRCVKLRVAHAPGIPGKFSSPPIS